MHAHLNEWLRPPRHLLAMFFAIVFTLAGALGWLGWRLVQQDRDLEAQRLQERLEVAAELITTTLRSRLSEMDLNLRRLAALPSAELAAAAGKSADKWDDGLVVVLGPGSVEAYPPTRLLFYPLLPLSKEIIPEAFRDAETLEFLQNDYTRAISVLRPEVQNPDPWIRGGALLRIARNLRKAGQSQAALETYANLGRIQGVSFAGAPAELVGLHARCILLEESAHAEDLQHEAEVLYAGLHKGRWVLARGAYEFYAQEAERWAKTFGARFSNEVAVKLEQLEALASGVEALWEEWQRLRQKGGDLSARYSFWIQDSPVLTFCEGTPERALALVIGKSVAYEELFRPLESLLDKRIGISIIDDDNHPIFGAASHAPAVVRRPVDPKLRWTVQVIDTDGLRTDQMDNRRGLLIVGLALMAVLIGAGTYFIARSAAREFKVARLQSDFVSAVSHEFRTPLASLRQLSELLADGRVSSEECRQQYYEGLRRESERLHRLVEGLLDFARMEAGAREYRFEVLSPSELVQAVSREFAEEVKAKGYLVDARCEPHLPAIRADREALGRAIWNLLENAVKYSPDCKQIWIDAEVEEGLVTIGVRDRGVGISLEEQERIFDKFVRGDGARSQGVKGTGLGLAMVKSIVAAHRGDVGVQSRPGEGSTFKIRLAAAKESA